MHHPLSVIILAKNEARCIEAAVKSGRLVSDDVIVVDSGSTDGTISLANSAGARVLSVSWPGFGEARNLGAAAAMHDLLLCIDADEGITEGLAASLNKGQFDAGLVYGFKRRNFLGNKEIRFGEWGHDQVYRLYNRRHAQWNKDLVHEMIVNQGQGKEIIPGSLLHYTTTDLATYGEKMDRYAQLSAEKYFLSGKKAGFGKTILSPLFSFIKNYIVRLGFLDGGDGLAIALVHARYTRNKYLYLQKLYKQA